MSEKRDLEDEEKSNQMKIQVRGLFSNNEFICFFSSIDPWNMTIDEGIYFVALESTALKVMIFGLALFAIGIFSS